MTALDMIALILMGGAGLLGLRRGFVTEALSLAAWLFALFAVRLFHAPASAILEGMVGTWGGAAVLALVLVFGVAFGLGKFVARTMGDSVKKSAIGSVDHALGLGFGVVKGLIGATLLYTVAALVHDTIHGGGSPRPTWMSESRTYPLLDATSRLLVDFVEQRRKGGNVNPSDQ